MKLKVVLSNRFKKDLKRLQKQKENIDLLRSVVLKLTQGEPLEQKYKDHALTGDLLGFRECHIKPDWLLIYRIDGDELILFLNRTGSHADLFKM